MLYRPLENGCLQTFAARCNRISRFFIDILRLNPAIFCNTRELAPSQVHPTLEDILNEN